ncbi:protein CcmA, bactofilin family [Halobiforma haloterrestris]|uniref:Protein CcmA, bactofilin family n=1 Tax=Natronobacterium haloterrestre TaxID=148448 RepID=A0A1I1GB74_NATHA|nr:polymer-forming cytoskeletal protein [Halobiforma haloterrestris]SFC08969.1 protein CcmA, bactofilin family [Halobiforma haloterrestris]
MNRSRSLRRRSAVLVLVAALSLSLGTGVVAAQSFEGVSGTVVVEDGETVDGIDGVAGSVVVRGTVTGDISGAAGSIHVVEGGTVEGSIEAAAGSLRIDGDVGGDVAVGGGHVDVSETGRIGGDLEAGSGYLSVDGTIDGDVRAGAETIVLGPNADVGGEFRYDADSFTEDPDATVANGVVQDPGIGDDVGGIGGGFTVPDWVGTVYGLLANLLLGAILLAVFPVFSSGVAGRVADGPVASGGVGFLTLIAVPITLAAAAITIVGIPLAILGAFAFGLAIWVAAVYGQFAVASWALGLAGADNRWLALVVGLVAFALLGLVPILGGLLEFVALLLGLGALAFGLRDAYRARRGGPAGGRQSTLDEVGDESAGSEVSS